MGLKSFLKKQFSTVIEWTNQDPNLLFYRIDTPTSEIKRASKLIVLPGQGCIVVYEGKVQDVLTQEGIYHLDTDNHPFVTTLIKLRQAFESEHKMHIYFFRLAEIVNQAWGTATPIKYVDPVYQFPVQLGCYGNYSARIAEPQSLFTNLIGSKDQFTANDMREVILGRIAPELTSLLAKSGYSYQDIDSHLAELSLRTKAMINQTIAKLGLELTDFRIESATFDEETCKRIEKIAGMTAEALSAAEVGLNYVEIEKLRALRDAARNEGGLAGAGLQVGVGLELSKTLVSQKDQLISESQENDDPVVQLKKLKLLLDESIITQDEFDSKKKDILDRI